MEGPCCPRSDTSHRTAARAARLGLQEDGKRISEWKGPPSSSNNVPEGLEKGAGLEEGAGLQGGLILDLTFGAAAGPGALQGVCRHAVIGKPVMQMLWDSSAYIAGLAPRYCRQETYRLGSWAQLRGRCSVPCGAVGSVQPQVTFSVWYSQHHISRAQLLGVQPVCPTKLSGPA